MAAPGVSIFSADKAGGTSVRSGTSRSAPQIAGAAAVILALDPAADVRQILRGSGDCADGTTEGAPCPTAWPGSGGSKEPRVNTYCAAVFVDPTKTGVTDPECPAKV